MATRNSTRVIEPEYGPSVYTDNVLIDESNRFISIDTDVMGSNLKRDFSELAQTDWENHIIYLTDRLPEGVAAVTINAIDLKISRSARLVAELDRKTGLVMSRRRTKRRPKVKWIMEKAMGHEVLTVINLSADLSGYTNGEILNSDHPTKISTVLAHELHHSTGYLLDNRILRERQEEVKRHYDRLVRYNRVISVGGVIAIGGLIETLKTSGDGLIPLLTSAGIMVAGLGLVGTTLRRNVKYENSPVVNTVYDTPPPFYGDGERCANAYAVATGSNWENVFISRVESQCLS